MSDDFNFDASGLTKIEIASIAVHEFFDGLTKAGFDRGEAFELTKIAANNIFYNPRVSR